MPLATGTISVLRPSDRARWNQLWEAYLAFYKTTLPNEVYDKTWTRLTAETGDIHAFGIRSGNADSALVGITHYLFHASAWTDRAVCYLQDLYVDDLYRGRGFAHQLIEAVTGAARARGCARLYWMTQETNSTARKSYDSIASFNGFIEYERPL